MTSAGAVPAWLPLAALPVGALVAAGLLFLARGRRLRVRRARDHHPSRDA